MWMTEDGQTHSAAFDPWMVEEGRALISAARGLSGEALENCRQRVERLFSDIDEPVERELSFSENESDWEGRYLPHEWLRFLRTELVLTPEGLDAAIAGVPARWKQDAVYFLESVFDEAAEPALHYMLKRLKWLRLSMRQ